MKTHRNVALTIAALAVIAISAGTANAQQIVFKGRFTLPFEATWDNAVLQPGGYSLSVVQLSSASLIYRVTLVGASTETTFLARKPTGPDVGKSSMLVAQRGEQMYCIRALHLTEANLMLTFPAPKARQRFVATVPEVIQSVPILMAAK
jgi:hypothetical protein